MSFLPKVVYSFCRSGKPFVAISFVQSFAVFIPCGFGANSPANSTFPVLIRSSEVFSHVQPPCIAVLTITHGNESLMRSSIAASSIVCVPPPLAPVIPVRSGSTSGSDSKKSSPRTAFHVCSPMIDCRCASACGLYSPQFSAVFISGRCFAKVCTISRGICTESESLSISHCHTTQPIRASCTQSD